MTPRETELELRCLELQRIVDAGRSDSALMQARIRLLLVACDGARRALDNLLNVASLPPHSQTAETIGETSDLLERAVKVDAQWSINLREVMERRT